MTMSQVWYQKTRMSNFCETSQSKLMKKRRECCVIDMACPFDRRVEDKEQKKLQSQTNLLEQNKYIHVTMPPSPFSMLYCKKGCLQPLLKITYVLPCGKNIERERVKLTMLIFHTIIRKVYILFRLNLSMIVDKYQDLKLELRKIWKCRKVTIMPIIVGALGIVGRGLSLWLKKINMVVKSDLIQKSCLLGTARIIRKVLEN